MRRGGYESMKLQKVGASIAQAPRAGGSQMDVVLQPDAAPARKIDARLDRDHRAGGEGGLAVLGRGGGCVSLDPDAGARRGAERPPDPGRRYRIAREGVGLPAGFGEAFG